MAGRIIAFLCGALFGAVGAVINFWLEKSAVHWGIVGVAALVMGVLAVLLGKKFWDVAVDIWPF
jgi:hypothetical protein